jgi:aspartate/methionine/tyrosine aminotransferase
VDVIEFYSRYLRPGMVDLSQSSARPMPITPEFRAVPWDAVRPPGGIPQLRAAVASVCYRSLAPEDILLCSGASEALVATALSLDLEGKPVVALPGSYPSFTATLQTIGARRFRSFEGCSNPACALATNPTAPAGRRFDSGAFIERALSTGAIPIVDEVHRHTVIAGSLPAAAAEIHPHAISIGDLSKPAGLGGLRFGWIATRNRRVRSRIERALQLITGGPSVLADRAALAALAGFDAHLGIERRRALCNAPDIYGILHRFDWSFDPPELGFTFAARPPRPLSGDDLARARYAGFFLVPCSALDENEDSCALRISLLADPACLHRALEILTPLGNELELMYLRA